MPKEQSPEKTAPQSPFEVCAKLSRNHYGLLENVEYHFNEDGSVNWRKMIPKEFLTINKDRFPADTDFSSLDVDQLHDSKLLILLGGIKHLAFLRGFTKVEYDVHHADMDYVAVSCRICWIHNYETSNNPVCFTGMAEAHQNNTKSFAKDFLLAIAENRAFVRAVRNFLRINIVGQDELGDSSKKSESGAPSEAAEVPSPRAILSKLMQKNNIAFDELKNTLTKENVKGAEGWKSIDDLPKPMIIALIERVKNKKAD